MGCICAGVGVEWGVATDAEIQEENRKVRRLQVVVNLVMNVLSQSDIPVEEASELVAQTRRFALTLFPDKAHTYDLIYQPKFRRILAEKYKVI
jgi:type II secretory pathway component PulL